jgi:hypothetical protein
MTLKQYLGTIIFTTAICWVAWFFILFNVDPFTADLFGFVLFYISLLLALIGSISVVYFIFYLKFQMEIYPTYQLVRRSFKNACIFAGIVLLLLVLQGLNLLNWWNLPILAVIFVSIIYYNQKSNQSFKV